MLALGTNVSAQKKKKKIDGAMENVWAQLGEGTCRTVLNFFVIMRKQVLKIRTGASTCHCGATLTCRDGFKHTRSAAAPRLLTMFIFITPSDSTLYADRRV